MSEVCVTAAAAWAGASKPVTETSTAHTDTKGQSATGEELIQFIRSKNLWNCFILLYAISCSLS